MNLRNPISKKERFNLFKRDSFTCQYCGCKSPEVVLEVDHIIPIAENGSNELINLITSCFDCNRGKGKSMLKPEDIIDNSWVETTGFSPSLVGLNLGVDVFKVLKHIG